MRLFDEVTTALRVCFGPGRRPAIRLLAPVSVLAARGDELRRSALVALACVAFAGCAVFDEDNRRTLSLLDRTLTPQSATTRCVLAPVALPGALVAGAADIAIVHPAAVIDDAWGDTVDWLWTPRDESRFRRTLLFPLVTVATPLVFVGDWLGRAAFAIPPRGDH